MTTPIRLLIVDDSTFVRKALRRVLADTPSIDIVGEARDGQSAVQLIETLAPDVVTLDLQMPGMNGLEVLRAIRGRTNARVIMVSTYMQEGTELAFQALEEGAVDFLDKTSVRNRMDFTSLGEELVRKIRQAAGVSAPPDDEPPAPRPQEASRPPTAIPPGLPRALVVVGASTGGPPAVRRLLDALPPVLPAAFIVAQHMPPGFTEGFARRLDGAPSVRVREASTGARLRCSEVLVVPSGHAVELRMDDAGWCVELVPAAAGEQHRPSIDRALERAAAFAGARSIAIVLTGMGADGALGARAVKAAGGHVYTQSAASCVIDGMPRAVREAVHVDGEGTPVELAATVAALVESLSAVGDGRP